MAYTLTPEQIASYKTQGYTDQDIAQALTELDQEEKKSPLQQSYQRTMSSPSGHIQTPSMFPNINQDNLIKWQLELDSILERVEHMLRGDKPQVKGGNLVWIPTEKEDERILNDFGVAEIMRILSMYLNRNTILSNYDEQTINLKVYDFGCEISDLIYLRYDSMGLEDNKKRKLYPVLVRELVDTIHSTYLRALHGGERESLREARTVTQAESPNMQPGYPTKQRGLLNPMRWMKGKY